ncbi:RABGAP1 [Cordylochernes scorpioides]|uniref:RABGAP1 n=1 Tax=Cordylochernes scorpioides TaxID=51811 RepID=A0ABY6L046_9ARAC|nr:RABGAP1 [Cordylochernes scorpioides]
MWRCECVQELQQQVANSGEMFTMSPSPQEEQGTLCQPPPTVPNSPCCLTGQPPSHQLPPDGEHTTFHGIQYLGCALICQPRSEAEIQKTMAILHDPASNSRMVEVNLSVPSHSEGSVILYDAVTNTELISFPIHHILFCARGTQDSREAQCFAFTSTQGADLFHCHSFKCDVPEAVMKILGCFSQAFRQGPKIARSDSLGSYNQPLGSGVQNNSERSYTFESTLEFKEEDSKGSLTSCPRDKDYFKFRARWEKKVQVSIQQVSTNKPLVVERCFGLLISPGRNVKHSDMQLIEMESFTKSPAGGDKVVYHISGRWNPNEPPFEVLNSETPRDTRVYLTVAMDLVFSGIQEPVRFIIETKAKVVPHGERFWYFTRKALSQHFYLRLREFEDGSSYEVVKVESTTQLKWRKSSLHLNLQQPAMPSAPESGTSPESGPEEEDDDEPLLSGTGEVRCETTQTEMESWSELLSRWKLQGPRPKQLSPMVHRGIPDSLRGEVWQLLARSKDDSGLAETYRLLINKQESNCENVIQRDIHRTFPAHDYFKDGGPGGQDALYKLCKAYSLYDQEVGYCQGLSFLVAALLLHMPEEQAFGLLIKIMFEYKFRDLFKNGLEELHRRLYLLNKLMEDQVPELAAHFADLGVEPHMFASQWFLTLFTAKFPLCVVYFILDLFFLDLSKKDLLALDFEGVLKFFRVVLPKKFRTEQNARNLLHTAVSIKVKKLKKYEKDYLSQKELDKLKEDPIVRLQRENKQLLDNNLRLEQENDDLAQELISSKLQLRTELEAAQENVEGLTRDLSTTKSSLQDAEEEKKRLETEVNQLKEVCRRELQQLELDLTRSQTIIAEYKKICNQLSYRLEKEQGSAKDALTLLQEKVVSCPTCSQKLLDGGGSAPQDRDDPSEAHYRELELELAQTKLALVEAQCRNQDLNHQLSTTNRGNTWLHKTLSSLRDVTRPNT